MTECGRGWRMRQQVLQYPTVRQTGDPHPFVRQYLCPDGQLERDFGRDTGDGLHLDHL